MAAIAELRAKASLDGKDFEVGVKKLGNQVNQFGTSQLGALKGMIAGAFSVGAIVAFGRSLLQVANEMNQMGDALNLGMGSMVALKTIGAENMLNFNRMGQILGKLRNAQGDVIALQPKMLENLRALNITQKEFVSLPVDQLLERIAIAYRESGYATEEYSAICTIFEERIGPKTMSMLKVLADEGMVNLKKRTDEARQGFESLARAQSTIERVQNAIQIGAGKMIGGLERFFEKQAHLYGFITGRNTWEQTLENIASIGQMPEEKPTSTAAADLAALELAQQKQAAIRNEKLAEFEKQKVKLAEDSAKKIKQIGESNIPPELRVSSLQAMGLIAGGITGGWQARMAERQEVLAEKTAEIQKDMNEKLAEIDKNMKKLLDQVAD